MKLSLLSAPALPELPPALAGRAGQVLGASRIGRCAEPPAVDWPVQTIAAPLLGQLPETLREIWHGDSACRGGQFAGIHWRRAGQLLFGVIELDEADFAGSADVPPLQQATEQAYRRIFELLDREQLPQLWRVWNYLADINGEGAGLERYRQFNIGRQQAFVEGARLAVGNVPAACAIGLAGGPLSIAFLAGATPAVPLENPRQVSAYNYPADYGPRAPTFSRAALVYPPAQEILFVSGTASIVGHRTVHVGDVLGQCRESMINIAAVLGEANRRCRSAPYTLGELAYRVYVRDAADFPVIRAALLDLLGPAAEIVFVQADICRHDLLLEIEAMALHTLGSS